MKIVVLKFGGTSVGTIKKIKKVAEIISLYRKKNYKVIVVSSAISGVTNDLIKKSKDINKNFPHTEYDVLVSSGEQVACSLIAGMNLLANKWSPRPPSILTDIFIVYSPLLTLCCGQELKFLIESVFCCKFFS